jgi:hypothetical protein
MIASRKEAVAMLADFTTKIYFDGIWTFDPKALKLEYVSSYYPDHRLLLPFNRQVLDKLRAGLRRVL